MIILNVRKPIIVLSIITVLFYISILPQASNEIGSSNITFELPEDTEIKMRSSSGENHQNLDDIFTQKLADYASLGYFPQNYESSLQATYYSLYILDAIGKLDTINQTAVLNYIMANYNDTTHTFLDKSAERYLTSHGAQDYYPLTSLLESNCYGVLSLNLLGNLSLIDTPDMIDFIWSCYNPDSSGFIGQPHNSKKYF